jgi:D-tyrosyl-tRNA(Tyr) deacylase
MRAVVQRVSRASVTVDGEIIGSIGEGQLVLLGIGEGDSEEQARWLAEKAVKLRIFRDEDGKFNRSLEDVGGSMLVVSQFTLYGDVRKGTRPSFVSAADPTVAEGLYERFCDLVAEQRVPVERGRFGAMMDVELVNDGPVTILLER